MNESGQAFHRGTSRESPESSNKLARLAKISRILLGKTPFEEKMKNVLDQIATAMDDPINSAIWIEVDNVVYGRPSEESQGEVCQYEISVDGESRGFIHADHGREGNTIRGEAFFRRGGTAYRFRLEISDLQNKLRQSEERYKKQPSLGPRSGKKDHRPH